MQTIWKFTLQVVGRQQIQVPEGAMLLSLQVQGSSPCIWALVDPKQPTVSIEVWTFGTGHDVPQDFAASFLGTYQLKSGALVFHVFADGLKR